MTTEKKRKLIIDVLFWGMVIFIVYFFMKYIAVWTLPFIIGLVVSIILQRPVDFLTRKTKISRPVWSIVLVLTVLLSLFAVIGIVIWRICEEANGFASWLTGFIPDIQSTFANISTWFSNYTKNLPDGVQTSLQEAPGAIIEKLMSGLANFATGFAEKVLVQGSGLLITVIFSVVASCYFTKDYAKVKAFILGQLSERKQKIVVNAKKFFVTNILKMLRGYILIMCITFAELFIGLSILGVEYAAVLAVIIAVLDILPVIGTGTVLIPWSIISMLMGNFFLGVGLLILYFVIIIVRNIIEPRIIGQQVGLPPLVTLITMYVGLKTFGVIGMMAFPVATIILVKLQEIGVIKIWNRSEGGTSKKEEKRKSKKASAEKESVTVNTEENVPASPEE